MVSTEEYYCWDLLELVDIGCKRRWKVVIMEFVVEKEAETEGVRLFCGYIIWPIDCINFFYRN